MKRYKLIIFDLDGTLVDSCRGIYNCIETTRQHFNLEKLSPDDLRSFIGPPIKDSFMRCYGFSAEKAQEALEVYRSQYIKTGVFEADPYPGIREALEELKKAGYLLSVATLKKDTMAEKMLKHFGLYDIFDAVCGIDGEGKLSKADLIKMALERLGVDSSETILIGDTRWDAEGAKEAGVDFAAVLYGFEFLNEEIAKEFSPDIIIKNSEDVAGVFLS